MKKHPTAKEAREQARKNAEINMTLVIQKLERAARDAIDKAVRQGKTYAWIDLLDGSAGGAADAVATALRNDGFEVKYDAINMGIKW